LFFLADQRSAQSSKVEFEEEEDEDEFQFVFPASSQLLKEASAAPKGDHFFAA
jgi:hypothetical protein